MEHGIGGFTATVSGKRHQLCALAAGVGILPSYVDQSGTRRVTSDRTRRALLMAMGIEASTEKAAARALEELRARERRRILSPVRVVDELAVARGVVSVANLAGGSRPREWELEIVEESGTRQRTARRVQRSAPLELAANFPRKIPIGYHRVRFSLRTESGQRYEGEQSLIVTPRRCLAPAEVLGRARAYGLLAQLYTLRSERNWGIGDLGDLRHLIDWAGSIGAAFVGLNPLHTLENRNDEISPYSPTSRLYRNVIYLDVAAIPEWRQSPSLQQRWGTRALQDQLQRLRASDHVRYDRVIEAKLSVLAELYRVFVARHRHRSTSRGRAFRRYLKAEGRALSDFATFVALRRHLGPRYGRDWHKWPVTYRDASSPAVQTFAAEHAEAVDFQCYLQFEIDRQLGCAAAKARSSGLGIGLYQDLAIGSAADGSDGWAFSDLFLDGVTLGAPPDVWHARGQNWGFHPLDPRQLEATGYDFWIKLVRSALAHSGALRIDHVMGLFRQFWIPAGQPPSEGAYLRFPAAQLLGILALESVRAGSLIIGEDLGTIPRGLPARLAEWGLLSTRVLYFQRGPRGTFLGARAYPKQALVSANTHDLVPFSGYWTGRDIALRQHTGQFGAAAAAAAAAERARDRHALLRRLRAEGVAPGAAKFDGDAGRCGAVHTFLAKTPSALLGISLDDLSGEVDPVNLPGTTGAEYPNWCRRLRLPVERFSTDPGVLEALGGVVDKRRSGRAQRGGRRPRGRGR